MRAMVAGLGLGLALLLSACAAPAEPQKAAAPAPAAKAADPPMAIAPPYPPEKAPAPTPSPTGATGVGPIQGPAAGDAPPKAIPVKLSCSGPVTQGGAILCLTDPGAHVKLGGKPIAIADKQGLAVIGLARDQATPASISVEKPGDMPAGAPRPVATALIEVLKRKDTVTSFEMECNKIAPQSEEEKKKASDSWLKKDAALKTFAPPLAPVKMESPVNLDGVAFSSSFGATRTYIPKTKDCEPTTNVHNGSDIAVGKGTEIHAPMAGTVILADPDLYFEGGCVFLDLGRGLVSVTMHMSRIDVKAGQVVKQGELLGLSGATGRVTGPHLHWAIKYRNVTDKDRGSDIWLDPMLMMKLDSTKLTAE